MIILTNIDLFMFMTSKGFEIGSCALVGNAIGSGNPKEAKVIYQRYKIIAFAVMFAWSLITFIFQN